MADGFSGRLSLPASCRLYQLSYQLVPLWSHVPPKSRKTLVWQQKMASYVIVGRIMTPHVEGMSAFYSDSLEMSGENAKGKLNESNSVVKGDMSEFSLITARSGHLQPWGNSAPSRV